MTDLEKALADIEAIKSQIARDSEFRGYGPATVALTGVLAAVVAVIQAAWIPDPGSRPGLCLAVWIASAVAGMALAGAEMVTRSRRMHSRLADEMIQAALVQFVPAAGIGGVLPVVLLRFAPDALWLLPGLWQIVFGLGIFASLRPLPQAMAIGGAWYLVCGLVVIVWCSVDRSLSPWAMGLPFGIGQLLLAAILYRALGGSSGGSHDET